MLRIGAKNLRSVALRLLVYINGSLLKGEPYIRFSLEFWGEMRHKDIVVVAVGMVGLALYGLLVFFFAGGL